jgi:Type VI secretion system (T6SS), amidase immunity protein
MTAKYDQQTLLKNWALSVCLAQVAKDARTAEDAGLTASAYLEYGKLGLEAYDEIRKLVYQYKSLQYDGSVKGEYNTMKCIDLFHSKDLARLTARLLKKG